MSIEVVYPRYYRLVPDPNAATNPQRRAWRYPQEYRVDGPEELKVRGGPFPWPDWSKSGLTEHQLLRTPLADVLLPPVEFRPPGPGSRRPDDGTGAGHRTGDDDRQTVARPTDRR